MTVAVAIEIGSGRTQTSGANKAQSPRLATLANQGLSQPVASGTESFRAGWQSLLVSLGSDVEGFSETEGAPNQGATSGQPTPVDAARKSLAAALPSTVGAGLRINQETEKGIGPASTGLKLAQTDARTVSSAERSAASLKNIATSTTEVKRTTANREPESATVSQRTHSVKITEPDVTAAVPLQGLIRSSLAAVSQAVAVIAVPSPVKHGTDDAAQTDLEKSKTDTLRDLFVGPLTGSDPASSSLHSSDLDPVDRTPSASAQKIIAETEVLAANKSAVPPVGPHAEGGNVPAASGIPTEAAAPNLANAQASSEDQPLTHGGEVIKPLSTNQVPPQEGALSQSENSKQLGSKAIPVPQDSAGSNPVAIAANAASSGQPSTVLRIEGNPGPADERKLAASDPLQPTRGTGKSNSVQHGNHVVQEQPSGPGADASLLARAVAGAGGVASTADGLVPRTPVSTSGPDPREAFATLDAEGATEKPTWIHAGAQRAEAGFQDPALGWVGVRAETSGGGVHAELVAGSADAAEALGGHLAGLNAYLAENHTPVETLTLSSSESGWTAPSNGNGSGDGMQQGSGHQTGQESTQIADSGAQFALSTAPELPARSVGRDSIAQTASQDAIHISVMA